MKADIMTVVTFQNHFTKTDKLFDEESIRAEDNRLFLDSHLWGKSAGVIAMVGSCDPESGDTTPVWIFVLTNYFDEKKKCEKKIVLTKQQRLNFSGLVETIAADDFGLSGRNSHHASLTSTVCSALLHDGFDVHSVGRAIREESQALEFDQPIPSEDFLKVDYLLFRQVYKTACTIPTSATYIDAINLMDIDDERYWTFDHVLAMKARIEYLAS